MSVNRYQPYLIVLYEDNAYKKIFTGFRGHPAVNSEQISESPLYRGWIKVKNELEDPSSITRCQLDKFPNALVLALIDSDEYEERIQEIQSTIDEKLHSRIFILGALKDAEALKSDVIKQGRLETLGFELAEDCFSQEGSKWRSEALSHNQSEINRFLETYPTLLAE